MKARLRILLLHQHYAGAAGNDRSADFARRWVNAGDAVTVIAGQPEFAPQPHSHPNLRVIRLAVPYKQAFRSRQRIWSFIRYAWAALRCGLREPRPDVVYAVSSPPSVGLVGAVLARYWRVPLVFSLLDVWPETPLALGRLPRSSACLLHWLTDAVYHQAKWVLPASPGQLTQVMARGVPQEKCRVVYNGTNVAQFQPVERPIAPTGPVRLVYAGALGWANQIQLLVQTLGPALASLNAELHLYGWGAERPAIVAYLAQNPAFPVVLHEPLTKPDLAKVLPTFDIGLVHFHPGYPVLAHNSANKFYDYLACGLPVAINYGGWQGEVLRAYQAGLSAPSRQPEAFLAVVQRLVQDPAQRQRMGQNARELAETRFSRAKIAQHVRSLLEEDS